MASREYVNKDDWDNDFWKYKYIVTMPLSCEYAINASCEGDAIDYLIDYLEINAPGYLMTMDEANETGYPDDYISGGNHGLYINELSIHITQIIDDDAEIELSGDDITIYVDADNKPIGEFQIVDINS